MLPVQTSLLGRGEMQLPPEHRPETQSLLAVHTEPSMRAQAVPLEDAAAGFESHCQLVHTPELHWIPLEQGAPPGSPAPQEPLAHTVELH